MTTSMDVLRWVKDHGGIEGVETMWGERARLWSALTDIALECGIDGSDGETTPEEIRESVKERLSRRLMPEGVEWPSFEDGSPVRFGDEFADFGGGTHVLHQVNFMDDDAAGSGAKVILRSRTTKQYDGVALNVWRKDSVKRPVPRVLDTDGVPIEVGDKVWHVADGAEYYVRDVTRYGAHLSEGDESCVYCSAEYLTHERPDSWERIEEDCSKFCIEYCDEHGLLDPECNTDEGDASTRHCADCGDSCEERMARDLVRRAKALAERGK